MVVVSLAQCNLRDLGGMRTRDGRATIAGRVFRSASPSTLTPDGRRVLRDSGLRTVIDLRTREECEEDGLLALPARSIHLPLFERPRANWLGHPDQRPRPTAQRYLEMLQDGLSSVVTIVHLLADVDTPPALLHCAAGRDRTGIVVALLLDLLGVEERAIADDYALSDRAAHDRAAHDTGRAHAATISLLLTAIRERFGSSRDLLATHGLSRSTMMALEHQFLSATKA